VHLSRRELGEIDVEPGVVGDLVATAADPADGALVTRDAAAHPEEGGLDLAAALQDARDLRGVAARAAVEGERDPLRPGPRGGRGGEREQRRERRQGCESASHRGCSVPEPLASARSILPIAILLLLAAGAALAGPGAARGQSAGAPGLGDPYFPLAGNGGYQVEHYDLAIAFAPGRGRIGATATIDAVATQALSGFNLDLRGLRVSSVSVNGVPGTFSGKGAELTVAPAAAIAAGAAFRVVVAYSGRPQPLRSPDGSPTGWIPTRDGAFVVNEPRGAITWFPCNDHPSDKASYSFTVTVPRGRTAVANGSLESVVRTRRSSTFVWRAAEPMASYLATVTTGRFRLRSSSAGGIPDWTAIAPGEGRARRALRSTAAVLATFPSYFGAYPFSSTGAIVDSGFPGVALETQTRPLYGWAAPRTTVVHELAHQWFGNAVTPERWSDIWLSEGFATWSEWLWHTGGADARLRRVFRRLYRVRGVFARPLWRVPPGAPGPKKLFSLSVYNRGALTLEALRQLIGDPAFYATLRRWVSEHLYGNASTQDFIVLAEAESGRELDRFFDLWLFKQGKPRDWQ
jgi:aminopeptidase N